MYYNIEQKSWMVGSGVGNNYAWMRCLASDGEEDSSSSSSGSDSEAEEDTGKPLTRAGAPDLFSSTWEYKMSSLQVPEDDRWMSDDWSLKAMALGGQLNNKYSLANLTPTSKQNKLCFVLFWIVVSSLTPVIVHYLLTQETGQSLGLIV